MNVWFYVINQSGEIVRYGSCSPDEIYLQNAPGCIVVAFETDPLFTDATHDYDVSTQTFREKENVFRPPPLLTDRN